MRPTLSGGTSPMNFSVTCITSTCAQRAPRQFFSNWPIRLRIASRTSSGISSATKTRNYVPSILDCQLSTLDSAPCFFSLRSPSVLLLPLLRIQEVPPHQVQGCLRSLPADAIAVAGQVQGALFAAGSLCQGDVHGADGFFRRTAAGAGNSGDGQAQRAARAPANSFGQRAGDFHADRTLSLEQVRGHVHPHPLQVVAVANHAAQEVRRAAGDACQPLGQQATGAAFGHGDRGAVQIQVARHHLFERLALSCENVLAERHHYALDYFL